MGEDQIYGGRGWGDRLDIEHNIGRVSIEGLGLNQNTLIKGFHVTDRMVNTKTQIKLQSEFIVNNTIWNH